MAYKTPQINALSQQNYFQGGGVSESATIQTQTIDYTEKKVEPKRLHGGTIWKNGSTLLKWSHFFLNNHQSFYGTKVVLKWGPSCGHENGSTVEPFRLHFFLSVYKVKYHLDRVDPKFAFFEYV